MRNDYDGLIHKDDGTRVDADTDQVVGGVNNYHQVGHKHHHIKGISKHHEPKIRSWHLGTIGENESVSEAMNRQEELDNAETSLSKKNHGHHNMKAVVGKEHIKSHAEHGKKHHKKHHSHA